MKIYMIINQSLGIVVNTMRWDGESPYMAPEGHIVAESSDPNCGIGWGYVEGIFSEPVAPPKTIDQLANEYEVAVQKYMDSVAKAAGYDNIFTAATYADEPAVPKFQADGQALRAWRSTVWAYCYSMLLSLIHI